jgi:hypothetical protein
MRSWAKVAGQGLAAQNECSEIKIRAERKAGELLAGMDGLGSHGGDRKSSCTPQLEALGIEKTQSHR